MNRREMILRTGAAVIGCGLASLPTLQAADNPGPKRKVLFFTKSSGYEHSVIKWNADKKSWAQNILLDLGQKHNIEFTFSKDGSLFAPDYLAQFDAYFFYTTGDLTELGGDKQPPMTAAGKAAFLDAIKNGKGFIGTHSAADTFHSPGPREKNNGENVDPYIAMLGGEFIIHGEQQKSRQRCVDAKFPGQDAVTEDFGPHEEWYALKDFAPNLHVLLVQGTEGMKNPMYQRPPYPSTWARTHGQGRVFYTNMGHREDIWTNPVFQSVLMGGVNWAVRNVDADVTPNLLQATPRCMELPTA
jgi:type 1 glutamine amidotransferase